MANSELGPLAKLIGVWEGTRGQDRAPSDDRGVENNQFKEQIVFEKLREVRNHEQIINGLRYRTTAWEIKDGATKSFPFHEEVGYWLWDAQNKQVIKSFIVPRGVTVLAGGTCESNATTFNMIAEVGSNTYGICSNKFLDEEFKTVKFEIKVTIHDDNNFSYEETSTLKIKNQKELFLHTDKNTLTRIKT